MSNFPRLLAAVQEGERSQWRIGDALIAECPGNEKDGEDGVNTGLYRRIEQAAQFLFERGFEQYNTHSLGQMRRLAVVFPKNRRHANLSYGVHQSAGTPDVLDEIVAGSRRKFFGSEYVRAIRAAQRRAEEEHRAAEREAAAKEAERAQREMEKAREQAREAQSKEAKERAREKAEEAKERRDEARERARPAPKGKTGKPTARDVTVLEAEGEIEALFNEALKRTRQADKALTVNALAGLRESAIQMLREQAITGANMWQRIAERLAKVTTDKRGHLHVVNE